MNGVLEGFVVIGVVIVVGYLLGRSGVLGPSAVDVLSRLAFFVASPALLFVTLAHAFHAWTGRRGPDGRPG